LQYYLLDTTICCRC